MMVWFFFSKKVLNSLKRFDIEGRRVGNSITPIA
jgi:hypothetical protein